MAYKCIYNYNAIMSILITFKKILSWYIGTEMNDTIFALNKV